MLLKEIIKVSTVAFKTTTPFSIAFCWKAKIVLSIEVIVILTGLNVSQNRYSKTTYANEPSAILFFVV